MEEEEKGAITQAVNVRSTLQCYCKDASGRENHQAHSCGSHEDPNANVVLFSVFA